MILIHCIMKTRSQAAIDEAVKGLLMLKQMPMPRPPKVAAVTAAALTAAVATHQRPRRAGVKY
jgi:hypothetical protein